LVGTWQHGASKQYSIYEVDDGLLQFDGEHPSGDRLSGILIPQGDAESFEAELRDDKEALFGIMRFVPCGSNGQIMLKSTFRKPGMTDWGKDIVASRVSTASASELHDDSITEARTENEMVLVSPINVPENQIPPPLPQYEDRLIDPDVWQCAVCTLINTFDLSACDACQNPRPAPTAPNQQREQDTSIVARISASSSSCMMEEVEIVDGQFNHSSCSSTEVKLDVCRLSKDANDPISLLAWLQAERLEEYHEVMIEYGYEDVDDLRAAKQSDLDDMFKFCSVKPGHMLRFRRALRRGVGGGTLGGSTECPVCLSGPQEGVNVALTPCGHLFCAMHATQAQKQRECPVCRKVPSGTQRIFA